MVPLHITQQWHQIRIIHLFTTDPKQTTKSRKASLQIPVRKQLLRLTGTICVNTLIFSSMILNKHPEATARGNSENSLVFTAVRSVVVHFVACQALTQRLAAYTFS